MANELDERRAKTTDRLIGLAIVLVFSGLAMRILADLWYIFSR